MMNRIVVLMNGKRKRKYPMPAEVELKDEYWINGERWVVVAVLSESPNPTEQEIRA